jgi:hypothetical protein
MDVDFVWDDIFNRDPCETQVLEVNSCGPAFDTWWLEDNTSVLLQAAKERAVDERDFELAADIRSVIERHFES